MKIPNIIPLFPVANNNDLNYKSFGLLFSSCNVHNKKPLNYPHIEDEVYKWWIRNGKRCPINAKEARDCINYVTLKFRYLEYTLSVDKVKRKIVSLFKREKNKNKESCNDKDNINNSDANDCNYIIETKENNHNNEPQIYDATRENEKEFQSLSKYIDELKKKKNLQKEKRHQQNEIVFHDKQILNSFQKEQESTHRSLLTKRKEFDKLQNELAEQKEILKETEKTALTFCDQVKNQILEKNNELQGIMEQVKVVSEKKKMYQLCTRFEAILEGYLRHHSYMSCTTSCCIDDTGHIKSRYQLKPWIHFRNHYKLSVLHFRFKYEFRYEWAEVTDFLKIFDQFVEFRNKMQHEDNFYDTLGEEEKKKFHDDLHLIETKVTQILHLHESDPLYVCSCKRNDQKRKSDHLRSEYNTKKQRI